MWLSLRVTWERARAGHKPRLMAGEGLCRPVRPKHICGFNSVSSQLDSKSVKHTALSLISVILRRALKTIDYCLDKEAWQEPGVYTAAMMEDFVRLFREALSKVDAAAGLGHPGRSRAVQTDV